MKGKACPSTAFHRVLVATDGSLFSKGAIDEAIGIAAVCGSSLTVLSVIEIGPEFEFWDPRLIEELNADVRKHLEAVKKRAQLAGIHCETVVREGEDAYKAIVDEAKKRKSDTIVLGSHGRTGLKRLMMGSVVSRVVGHAPCRVLIVPPKGKRTK